MPEGWAARLLRWQARHGRRDLPWQGTRDPYRVWLSEIMLQQTQVFTVREYYTRFVQRFPDVRQLAAVDLDDVLALWSGLGYYSRARYLHACALQVVTKYDGEFPRTAAGLQSLPGIGPSTAAAIASICHGERVAILDGNVKRVLTRLLGFEADLAQGANERALWQLATALLPRRDLLQSMPRYTQGVMDLGATVCLPRKPACALCPAASLCVALAQGRPEHYPVKTRKLKRTAQSLWLLWAHTRQGSVWLRPRPTPGVWAGLYCMELFDSEAELTAAVPPAYRDRLEHLPVFTHVLTHKDLRLHPVRVALPSKTTLSQAGAWLRSEAWPALGLPAPVRKLLQQG
ncbi:MAG: A/G-specific adenine glycosylase [Curvibacter sp.]|nr:A/G-specific adenine glycosylase [Curvibacter sp.]